MAVLTIHATHDNEVLFNQNHIFFSSSFAGVILNQIARFCVPVFVLLSGYGLTKKYGRVHPKKINIPWALDFYQKRFLKIGIPFFFWTVVILFWFDRFSFEGSLFNIIWSNTLILLKYLFVYGADYHFYFFTIILECYLLYPIILKFRSPLLLFLSGIIHLMYIFPEDFSRYTGVSLYLFPSSFPVYWLLYFYMGILSAEKGIESRIKSMPLIPLISIGLLALSYVIYEYGIRSFGESNPDFYNHFNRLSVLTYSLLFWISFIRMDAYFENLIKSRNHIKITGIFSGLSFGVYIYHTMILRVLNGIFPEGNLFIVPSVIVLSFVFMLFLDSLVRVNYLRIVFGLPEKIQDKVLT
jgi:surface polysaccharide O-acyltransferase-like enzyme